MRRSIGRHRRQPSRSGVTKVEITKPSAGSLAHRIEEHLGHASSDAERRDIALTWSGYVGSLLEWGALEVAEHRQLVRLLKADLPEDAPIRRVFLGFHDEDEGPDRTSPAAE